MPTYDYVCDACQHKFELFQSIKDDPIQKCPECKKKKVRRLIGAGAGIIFKGSGFYSTDYRSDSYRQRAEADKKAAAESSGSDSNGSSSAKESKSDGKSDGKSESKASSGDG
jgi:putative FmdB family regulatory protein